MMRKALVALAVLTGVMGMAIGEGRADDRPASSFVRTDGASSAAAVDAIRQSFGAFLRQTPRPVPRIAQTPLNDVCRLDSGYVCTVYPPQPVHSVCVCGSAQGVIEPLQ